MFSLLQEHKQELKSLLSQLFGFRSGRQCWDIVFFLVESFGEVKNCSSSPWMWRARSIRSELMFWVMLERGASAFSAAAVVRKNLELRCRPCLGHTQCATLSLDVGLETRRPQNTFRLEPARGFFGRRTSAAFGRTVLWQVSWAPEWNPFEILVWADNIFLVTCSIAEAEKRTQEKAHVFGKKKLLFNSDSLEILPSIAAAGDKTPILLNWEDGIQVGANFGCTWLPH